MTPLRIPSPSSTPVQGGSAGTTAVVSPRQAAPSVSTPRNPLVAVPAFPMPSPPHGPIYVASVVLSASSHGPQANGLQASTTSMPVAWTGGGSSPRPVATPASSARVVPTVPGSPRHLGPRNDSAGPLKDRTNSLQDRGNAMGNIPSKVARPGGNRAAIATVNSFMQA